MALPEHPELKDLLFFINTEVKHLLNTEGSIAILHDEIKGDLFISGAAQTIRKRKKGSRISGFQWINSWPAG